MTTGFLYDDQYLIHNPGVGHPESPERLKATLRYLETLSWFEQLTRLEPKLPDPEWIEKIHSLPYLSHVQSACRKGLPYLDSMDVGICKESFDIALLAVGGVLECADHVMKGEIQNAFACVRPPGHHAEKHQALGFCLFNNIAILARYLQEEHRLKKILIFDWDVHHGNGTQHSFYEDPTVYYMSLHQSPFYPGTGLATETGIGKGRGMTLNCPMPSGAGNSDYEKAFIKKMLPEIKKFKPEAILISAGFDAHASDPLAEIELTTDFYGWMSEQLKRCAEEFSEGRLISVLEGGYDLEALPRSIARHLAVLSENQ